MSKKKLVIIAGITGAVGTALLEQFGSLRNTVVLGISRQARRSEAFISNKTGKLYASTLICSLPEMSESSCVAFVSLIDFEQFSDITYIHCVGTYLFEIDQEGHFMVANDCDHDGINDECMLLSYNYFRWMTVSLIVQTKTHLTCAIFAGLADQHRPRIIQSWWRSMARVKEYMKTVVNERVGMFIFNISSVLCPHEIITRPYVFVNTEADSRTWLSPYQLATSVRRQLQNNKGGYHAADIFNPWNGFYPEFYSDEQMVPRRLAETQRRK
ncbi:MAG: hypothetical protein WBO92_02100 [Candidatus Moraniibacteriota bacterium]